MTDNYPAWVKPHLRKRLEEEAAAKVPKEPTNGLTPAAHSPVSTTCTNFVPQVGNIVRFAPPLPNSPQVDDELHWLPEMDDCAGYWQRVSETRPSGTVTYFKIAGGLYDFWYSSKWITRMM